MKKIETVLLSFLSSFKRIMILAIIISLIISAVISFIFIPIEQKAWFMYPEEVYQELEENFWNITVVNGNINFENISDKSIICSYSYFESSKDPGKYEITLSKEVSETMRLITVTGTANKDLNRDSIEIRRDRTKSDNTFYSITCCIIIILTTLVINWMILLILLVFLAKWLKEHGLKSVSKSKEES